MARPESSILTNDKGRAQTSAILVLSALAAAQLWLLGWSAWLVLKDPAKVPDGALLEDFPLLGSGAGSQAPRSGQGFGAPREGSNAIPQPPNPGELAGMPAPQPGLTPGLAPPEPGMLAGENAAQAPGMVRRGPAAPSAPDLEVMELLQTVSEMREAGETESLLELLRAAEGMDQNNPAVLKEYALTYEQMGLIDKAREYWRRIVISGERAGVELFSLAQQRLARLSGQPGAVPAPAGFVPGPGAALTPPNQVGGVPALTPTLPTPAGKVTHESGAVLGIGPCQVVKDMSVAAGDRRTLRIPIMRVQNTQIEPSEVNVDVFFYDRVNETRVEPTRADPPAANWVAAPVDWFGEGIEPLDVIYFLPPMTAKEVQDHGERAFHGYLVKLYYQNRLQAVAAEPQDLLDEPAAAPAPAAGR